MCEENLLQQIYIEPDRKARESEVAQNRLDYYLINSKPTTATRLPITLRVISSSYLRKIAAAMKMTTTLNVVTAETMLKLPTTNVRITHDKDWKNRRTPVVRVSRVL